MSDETEIEPSIFADGQDYLDTLWLRHDSAERDVKMWKRRIDEFHKQREEERRKT